MHSQKNITKEINPQKQLERELRKEQKLKKQEEEKAFVEKYSEVTEKIKELGFTKLEQIVKSLHRNNEDEEATLEFFKAKKDRELKRNNKHGNKNLDLKEESLSEPEVDETENAKTSKKSYNYHKHIKNHKNKDNEEYLVDETLITKQEGKVISNDDIFINVKDNKKKGRLEKYYELFPEEINLPPKDLDWKKFNKLRKDRKKDELSNFMKLQEDKLKSKSVKEVTNLVKDLTINNNDDNKININVDKEKVTLGRKDKRNERKHAKDIKTNKVSKDSKLLEFDENGFLIIPKEERDLLNTDTKKSKDIFTKESQKEKESRIAEIINKIKNKEIETLFLDGNNMLFVDNTIRKDCLSKNKNNGELKLSQLVYAYALKNKIKNSILVFDNTKQIYIKESEGVLLKVSSAYPEFESSDDAFKVWAGGLNAEKLSKMAFITSDRELTLRLKEKNVSFILKSGEFMKEVKAILGDEVYNNCLNIA